MIRYFILSIWPLDIDTPFKFSDVNKQSKVHQLQFLHEYPAKEMGFVDPYGGSLKNGLKIC